MRKIACFTLIMLLGWQVSWAQDLLVKGVVTGAEDGLTIPGVSVVVKGTTNGTTTDFDGKYEIKVGADAILVFSYIGMKPFETAVGTQAELNVVLQADNFAMDEVVVVGYGVQKKSDITGAVASVDFEDLESQPINTVSDALKGRIAGVSVVSNSGAPGGSISIRVRGIGTVNNADPLYVVDGIPTTDINFLNPNDIASIEVLKDASSSAIYGSRGANGVVLVSTKSGKSNTAPRVDVDAYYGVKEVINNWETTSGSEWYSIQEEMNKTRTSPLDLSQVDKNVNTDWFDEITRSATVQDYNVSVSGGSDKLTYILGAGYYDEEGTVKGSDYERITTRLKTDYQAKEYLKIGTNINIQSNKRSSITEGSYHTGVINTAIKLEPVIPVWINESEGKYDYSKFTDYPNPVAQIAYDNYRTEQFRLLGNVFAELEIIKDLKLKTSYGLNRSVTDTYDFDPVYFVNTNQSNGVSKVYRGYDRSVYQTWENTLTYNKTIGKHDIGALVGFTKEKSRYEWLTGSKTNVPNEDEALWYLDGAADGDLTTGSAEEYSLMSYLGRINYSYDNKYLMTVNFRADGSSRFADGNRWGYFPSVALGWKLSEENFMKDINWLSILKLRGGWGQIGNQNIGVYPYQTTMNGSAQYRYIFGNDEAVNQGYVVTSMKDRNIQWETVESLNLGFDAALFDARLEVSFDWFNKDTKNMLLSVPIPYYYGYEAGPVVNVGEANNKGMELSFSWRDQIGKDFSYNIGLNVSTYKNEMKSLGSGQPIIGGAYYLGNATKTEEGESIGYFYGYKTDGVFQTQAEIDAYATQGNNSLLQPGDMKFVDVTGDGIVDGDDRTKLGSPDPDYTYGINLGAQYKNWEISAFIQGSKGNEIFNAMKTHLYKFDETSKHKDMLNSWTPTNTNTNMPRLTGYDRNDTNRTSDRFVEDGSYMRLKNLMVAYNFPKRWLNRAKLSSAKLYFSGQNLWTITDYTGADPEIGQISSTNYLSRGVDIGTYPQAKTYVVGVKLGF
ncbi:SusC/RagA family TonB-linked outer membrane protein [Labilibaculum euxinus]|uniref:SusC/RagA family TonB-linked outer membrane protein n=1 Tax=Labilibaculum euxinus TaxID=2686357 RepID=A0A7M4D345_9BACT|nr:TonB-dependent receptor [Labilibaculum euxinus]MUP37074.1 SusC/RagA family TonB-linked outer membrane protein [Labilibaculum euxinus]MVB06279.1 SusC/RagA family TonB-linked outer membrane protein [Labilibaculum euxinus]